MTALGLLLRQTERRLARAGIGDASLEASLIWMTALDLDRTQLYAALRDTPTDDQAAAAEELTARRLCHEPAAYLMGHREFFGLDFQVAPGVLIPRQDTETLVEEALRLPRYQDALVLADIGCGSGAIAIALAVYLPASVVYAVDVSPRALEITMLNAERHGVARRISPLTGSLLAPLPGPVDAIVANLPYVMSVELPTLDPEIRLFEPHEALDGGEDGLDLVRGLLTQAPEHLLPGGAVVLEMDPRQIAAASVFAQDVMPHATLRVVHDLAGRDRVLVVETGVLGGR